MNIYDHLSYKSAIKEKVKEIKANGKNISLSWLSEKSHIQKSYLSKILSGGGHFNSDQLYLICKNLKFNKKEQDYIFLLLELEKSNCDERRTEILLDIEKRRSKILQSEIVLSKSTDKINNNLDYLYYTNINAQLVHMYLTISRFQKNPDLIQQKLKIKKAELSEYLNLLIDLGVITFENGNWVVKKQFLHLSNESKLFDAYRILVKAKSIQKIQESKNESDYTFSVFFSGTSETKKEINKYFLDFIQKSQSIVSKANPEEVFQLNFDLLSWS